MSAGRNILNNPIRFASEACGGHARLTAAELAPTVRRSRWTACFIVGDSMLGLELRFAAWVWLPTENPGRSDILASQPHSLPRGISPNVLLTFSGINNSGLSCSQGLVRSIDPVIGYQQSGLMNPAQRPRGSVCMGVGDACEVSSRDAFCGRY